MQVYQERRKIHKLLRSEAVIGILGLFVLVLLVASIRMSLRAYRASEARLEAESQLARLAQQKDRIDGKIEDLANPEMLDKEAKKRFNVTAPGEKVLIIVNRREVESEVNPPHTKAFEFIKNLFKFNKDE
jgi:cell division protein FtsB